MSQYQEYRPDDWPPSTEGITDFLASLRSRGLTQNSIAGYYRALRTWVNWLLSTNTIANNPLTKVDAPKPQKQKIPKAPPNEVIDTLFGELETEVSSALRRGNLIDNWLLARDLALISFMVGTGTRVKETSWMDVSDLDPRHCLATMRTTKSQRERDVGYSDRVASDLKLWLGIREHIVDELALSWLWVSFQSGKYQRFTPCGIRQMLEIRCNRYGLPVITPHQFRHFWANSQVQNKASIYDISQQLGHASIETTEIYFYAESHGRRNRLNESSPR